MGVIFPLPYFLTASIVSPIIHSELPTVNLQTQSTQRDTVFINMSAYKNLQKPDLLKLCVNRGIKFTGAMRLSDLIQCLVRDDVKNCEAYVDYDLHNDPTGELEEAQSRKFDALDRDELLASDLDLEHRTKVFNAAEKELIASQNERVAILAKHEARRVRRELRHGSPQMSPEAPTKLAA